MKVSYHDYNQTVKYQGRLFSITCINGEIYSISYANLLKWTGTDWIEKAFFIKQIPLDSLEITLFVGPGDQGIFFNIESLFAEKGAVQTDDLCGETELHH